MQHLPMAFVDDLIYKDECYLIIGAAMRVHSKLGKGFKEVIYKDALEVEFLKYNITYEREKLFNIAYENVKLPHGFEADFFVYDAIVLEIKAKIGLSPDNFRQTLNYLKASRIKLGLLINFGESSLKFHRIVCSY
jgi:GxxExxY protein